MARRRDIRTHILMWMLSNGNLKLKKSKSKSLKLKKFKLSLYWILTDDSKEIMNIEKFFLSVLQSISYKVDRSVKFIEDHQNKKGIVETPHKNCDRFFQSKSELKSCYFEVKS